MVEDGAFIHKMDYIYILVRQSTKHKPGRPQPTFREVAVQSHGTSTTIQHGHLQQSCCHLHQTLHIIQSHP